MARRAGLYKALEDAIRRSFFENEEDAEQWALRHQRDKDAIQKAREEAPLRHQLPLLDMAGDDALDPGAAQ